MSQKESVQLQLIEPQKGETIFDEFLKEKGEGLHHMGFRVEDLKDALDEFDQRGIGVLQQDRFVGGGRNSLFGHEN